ncbi:cadherin-like beta sandwich domain-containing protein [Cohnella fermenti]|uniref:cadherin-like beta sandwich domain-containing protein n=1 Tax=Cohnella fermenti TaxID=2565925 RepID=UPI001454DEC3|nr:cadherin-like beta sandwich domain-containing protein [Cohnella fermenti]
MAALLLIWTALSGCVSTQPSVIITITDGDTLEANEQIYLLFNDGTSATTEGQAGQSSITIGNPEGKTIVGAWVYDSVAGVSWVPEYSYGGYLDQNAVYISKLTETKPQIPAVYAIAKGKPTPNSTYGSGYYDVTFALYGAGENAPLVDGQTGVFAQTTDQVTFMDLDPKNAGSGTVTNGLASFTQNGFVTFQLKSSAIDPDDPKLSSIPFKLKTASGYIPIYSDTDLSSLSLSAGELSPSFDPSVTSYTVDVENEIKSLSVTAAVYDSQSSIAVNDAGVASGTASGAIDLAVGANEVEVVVTAEDGTEKTYTVTVNRAEPPYVPSSDATLSGLTVSVGTLSPAFDAAETTYHVDVANGVESVTVTPTVSDSKATVSVGDEEVASGTASEAIALAVGANEVEVVVTAEDGTEMTYTITVNRAEPPYVPSSDATLSSLSVSAGTLSPAFDADETTYHVDVANGIESVTVTPTVSDSKATVSVGGEAVDSGTASGAIALAVGANEVEVVVTAEDGTEKTYTVTVNRAEPPYVPSSDATLSGLSVSAGTLSPVFDADETTYHVDVANGIESVTVTPTVSDGKATVSVGDEEVASGTASGAIDLAVGANEVEVVVTAEDGTEMTYTITVNRAEPPYVPSSDATLSGLSVSAGTLSPVFDADETTYHVDVANGIESVTVTPTVSDGKATVSVGDEEVASGTASEAIALAVGANEVEVVVTAEDGTEMTYTITVNRAEPPYVPSSDATLSGLSVSAGTLSPAFDADETTYHVDVANGVESVTVTPTVSDGKATVSVGDEEVASGTASEAIALAVGANEVEVVVTAEDGTEMTYTVTVNRASAVSGGGSYAAAETIVSTNGTLNLPVGFSGQVSLDGELSIQIPSNATNRELKLTISKVLDAGPLLANNEVLASSIYEILKNFEDNFANPVTLTFVFDPSSLKEVQKPSVFYYDEAMKEWVEVGGLAEGNRISVDVDHFTKYAVLAVGGAGETEAEAEEVNFSDISGHWAEAAIRQAASLGIVQGYKDGTFKPAAIVTRAEFAVMLMNATGAAGEGMKLTFSDSASIGAWAKTAVAQALEAGIVTGYSDGTFRPDAPITRAEMAAMIAKTLTWNVDEQAATGFADDASIPSWARGAVTAIGQHGLMEGNEEGKFLADARATRAEAATVLLRMLAQRNS